MGRGEEGRKKDDMIFLPNGLQLIAFMSRRPAQDRLNTFAWPPHSRQMGHDKYSDRLDSYKRREVATNRPFSATRSVAHIA